MVAPALMHLGEIGNPLSTHPRSSILKLALAGVMVGLATNWLGTPDDTVAAIGVTRTREANTTLCDLNEVILDQVELVFYDNALAS